MSTIKKRIPMFLLALAMMVAMALPTFAAEPRALLDVLQIPKFILQAVPTVRHI